MKLFKKINNINKLKNSISLFIVFFLINNLIAFGSDNKSEYIKSINEDQFEETYFKNSIPFNEYDNLESQLKIFFGRYSQHAERNLFYPDLSIIESSAEIREIYRSKLNDMAVIEIIDNNYK